MVMAVTVTANSPWYCKQFGTGQTKIRLSVLFHRIGWQILSVL